MTESKSLGDFGERVAKAHMETNGYGYGGAAPADDPL